MFIREGCKERDGGGGDGEKRGSEGSGAENNRLDW